MSDIRSGLHTYFVNDAGYRSDVHMTADVHLRTDADATSKNNLDNLPDY